jgi:hypothetical protein
MLSLQDFEVTLSRESVAYDPWNNPESEAGLNYLSFWWRSRKVAQAQEQYRGSPRSLICPSCLYVLKR